MEIIDRKFLNTQTKSCHASTSVFYKNQIVFAWFGGNREGLPDSSIYVQFNDEIKCLGSCFQIAHWNPILFAIEDKLFLFYKVGIFCDRWQTIYIDISDIFEDNFKIEKAEKIYLPAGLNGPVKTKPIVHDDIIYMGSSVETILDWTSYIESYFLFENQFVFLNRSKPLTVEKQIYTDRYNHKRKTQGILQPTMWIDDEQNFNAFFRSSSGLDNIYHAVDRAYLEEYGRMSWSFPTITNLKNPNASVDTVYVDNRLFLVHNPSDTYRFPLVVSELDKDFDVINELEINDEPKEGEGTAEFSYPYLIENDKELHLTYTHQRRKIEYVTIGI